jgi:hypothetical protein
MLINPRFLLIFPIVVMMVLLSPAAPVFSSCGDVNGDGSVSLTDLVYLMNYCFKSGPPPWNPDTAEVDGYEYLNIRDAVYLENFLYYGGPWPVCPATNPEYQSLLEQADTLRIPTTTLLAGDSLISVPVWYKNSKSVRGIGLQLKINIGDQIPHIDSLSLGSRLSGVNKWVTLNNPAGTVNSGFLFAPSNDSLLPGSGNLFTLYLSTDPESYDRRVLVDTLRLSPYNSSKFIKTNTEGAMPFFVGLHVDSILFAPAVNYPTGDVPYSVFCGDLDGDGDLDLAVADYWDSNHVSILKNNGNGTFQSNVDYDAGSYPISVFCADLDGDGDLDLATANYLGTYSVSILKNNGDGTFQNRVGYGTGDGPYSVFCADLDGDGDLDLAVANYYSNNVSILKNNGDGTFQPKVDYAVGATPVSVFCADLDGDGDLDLAVADYNGGRVSILKNNGDGTFQTKVDYGILSYPYSVFCGDLDGDADLDLAVVQSQHNKVSILKNNGDGTFQANVDYGTGEGPVSVFCADLDGDGDLDLATANWAGDNVSILKNNGNGTFQAKVDYGVGDYPTSVFSANLDGDADLDLVTTNRYSNNVSILKNLTQIPANQPPWPFHLIYPGPTDTTFHLVPFSWRVPYDPNLGDQIRYDLYVSTTPGFEPSTYIVDSNLVVPHQTDSLQTGTYYWKVKAKDNWGAYSWSQVTFSFFHSDYVSDTLTVIAFSPVDLIVTDPKGDSVSLWYNTIPAATYDTTQDYNHDGDKDDIVTIPDRLVGVYQIEVVTEPGGSGNYELGIRIDGGAPSMLTMPGGNPCPGPGEVDTFTYNAPWYKSGDANGDWMVDVGDVVYLINYLYKSGSVPDPLVSGDATCNGYVDVGDVVYLINYLFKGGPEPCK